MSPIKCNFMWYEWRSEGRPLVDCLSQCSKEAFTEEETGSGSIVVAH